MYICICIYIYIYMLIYLYRVNPLDSFSVRVCSCAHDVQNVCEYGDLCICTYPCHMQGSPGGRCDSYSCDCARRTRDYLFNT